MNKDELSGKTIMVVGSGSYAINEIINRVTKNDIVIMSPEQAKETTIPSLIIPTVKEFKPPITRAERRKKKK